MKTTQFQFLKNTVCSFIIAVVCTSITLAGDQNNQPPQKKEKSSQEKKAEKVDESKIIVAEIGRYKINKQQLKQNLLYKLMPEPENALLSNEPVTPENVLLDMIAEKAIVLDARKKGLKLKDAAQQNINEHKEKLLIRLLGSRFLKAQKKVAVRDLKKKLKENPKLDRKQAILTLRREKAIEAMNKRYEQLCKELNLKKFEDNYKKVITIHNRLLFFPKEPRKQSWILNKQVKTDLTDEEKNTVLAEFNGGKVTILDWFRVFTGKLSPPSRTGYNTIQGVKKILNSILRKKIMITEAIRLGLAEDKDLKSNMRQYEDYFIFDKVRGDLIKDIKKPTAKDIKEFFNKNKSFFGTPANVKADVIWCDDKATALKVKQLLDKGKDFSEVKKQYSLQKKGTAYEIYENMEIFAWDKLYAAEPNQIVGPVRGLYTDGLKWRVIKVLNKTPGKPAKLSDIPANQIAWAYESFKRNEVLSKHKKKMLKKYKYKIYKDMIKDLQMYRTSP